MLLPGWKKNLIKYSHCKQMLMWSNLLSTPYNYCRGPSPWCCPLCSLNTWMHTQLPTEECWESTVTDNQNLPVLVIWLWHWKKYPKRSETAEMNPFNVKEEIGMSQSLKKAIFSFFDPQNLAVPLNNSLKIPKNVQSTPFWCLSLILVSELQNITSSGINKHTKTSI